MLKTETKKKIAELLKIKEADLDTAIKAETEVDLAIPEVQVFTADEITARDESKVNEGKKAGEKEGETKGKEIAVKELKKAFGVEFEGKDLVKLSETVKTQLGKGDEGLRQQVTQLQTTLAQKDEQISAKQKEAEAAMFDAKLLSSLPAARKSVEDGGLTDAEYLATVKANMQFETADGSTIVKRNGQIVQDEKTYKPLAIPDVMSKYFAERKWVGDESGVPAGRGGKSTPAAGNKPGKLSEAMQAWEKDGKSTAVAEFQTYVNSLVKDNKDFEFDAV